MILWLLILISGLTVTAAWANPDEVMPPSKSGMSLPEPTSSPSGTSRKSARRSGTPTIKDADGTAAPNRFEAETVIKSSYTLDGKPLEVDPD